LHFDKLAQQIIIGALGCLWGLWRHKRKGMMMMRMRSKWGDQGDKYNNTQEYRTGAALLPQMDASATPWQLPGW
jgi:hypothetical protein